MTELDLLRSFVHPGERLIAVLLLSLGVAQETLFVILGLVGVLEFALLGVGLAWVASWIQRRLDADALPSAERSWMSASSSRLLFAVVGVAAILLFGWIATHAGSSIEALIGRWDHVAFAVLAGLGLARCSRSLRLLCLTIISLVFLVATEGWAPVGVSLAAGSAGVAALRLWRPRGAFAVALGQIGVLLGAVMALAWWRSEDGFMALRIHGLFSWVALRHVSFVVEVFRGRAASLLDYYCFLFFYPNAIGASELFDEFASKNLEQRGGPCAVSHLLAARKLAVGGLLYWFGLSVPVTFEAMLSSGSVRAFWFRHLLLFVRSGCAMMGIWAIIEAVSLFYGIRLRPNFSGVLTACNPAQFWRAWRGTMTSWLIRYVYIPLGGNRRHQLRNVFVVFVVSAGWHWSNLPLLYPDLGAMAFAPIGAWALLNALGVAAWVALGRRERPDWIDRVPAFARMLLMMAITAAFGSLTPGLLGFGPSTLDALPNYLRLMFGMGLPAIL